MSIPTEKQFYYEIRHADNDHIARLYERLVEIEKRLIKKEIAASTIESVFNFQSLAFYLQGIELQAPRWPIFDDKNDYLGEVSLPDNLQDFLQGFCLGSTRIAYQLLKECKAIARKSQIRDVELIHELQTMVYFMDLIDRVYYFHIGYNQKYSGRIKRTANINQLKYSETYLVSGSKKKIEKWFLKDFNNRFSNESLPIPVYSLGPMLERFCQYCHRPNILEKRYCYIHKPNEIGNNSLSNSIANTFKKSFRNLGLLLHDEGGFIQNHPEDYIKLAEERRVLKAKNRLRIVQNDIKSEYFIRLEGWAKHHPIYLSFVDKISEISPEYDENPGLFKWENEAGLELISKILDISRREIYIDPKRIQVDISRLPPVEIKAELLGKYGLDIELDLHPDISIDDWITMLCRNFQYQLVIACKNKKAAKDLAYL